MLQEREREKKEKASIAYWLLTISNRTTFDVINALEESFLEQMDKEADFVRYACSELENRGYLIKVYSKPKRDHLFWDTDKYILVSKFIASERPDLSEGDSEVSFKCVGHPICNPNFDYSSGEYLDEEKNKELMLNLKKF